MRILVKLMENPQLIQYGSKLPNNASRMNIIVGTHEWNRKGPPKRAVRVLLVTHLRIN